MGKVAKLLAGALLVIAGVVAGWSVQRLLGPRAHPDPEDAAEKGGEKVAPAAMQVPVVTEAAAEGRLALVVPAAGVVRADPSAICTLSSRAGGRVIAAMVASGQRVAPGDPILEFDPAPLVAAVAEARGHVEQTTNELAEFDASGRERQIVELQAAVQRAGGEERLAAAQAARLRPLREEGLVAEKALAEAEKVAEQARQEKGLAEHALAAFLTTGAALKRATLVAARTAAEAAIKEAEVILGEAVVKAPAEGQVLGFSVHRGDRIDAGAPFGSLLTGDGRIVVFGVPPGAAGAISVGAAASWTDAAGERRTGVVARIVPEVSMPTGLVEVVVTPDGGGPPAPPGLLVRGEIEIGHLPAAVLVTDRAVLRSEDRQVVVVAGEGGLSRIVPVKVLGRHGGRVAVEGAVRPGDRVIVDGGYNLPEGAHVVEKPAAPGAPAAPAGGERR